MRSLFNGKCMFSGDMFIYHMNDFFFRQFALEGQRYFLVSYTSASISFMREHRNGEVAHVSKTLTAVIRNNSNI
jgi:hypothetical protein